MTTEQLRKNITVKGFSLSRIGIYITYTCKPSNSKHYERTLNLDPVPSLTSLEQIGAIKKFEANPLKIWWDSIKGTPLVADWPVFVQYFIFSQYEAITLVVRHEYEQSLKSDMNLLEIDKTLEALKD